MTNKEFYFFSRHVADVKMLEFVSTRFGIPVPLNPEKLGDAQFFGTISNVKKAGLGEISFTETLKIEENGVKRDVVTNHTIAADAVIVLVGPITLQQDFLNAGATALAIPQTTREVDAEGNVSFKYSGLLHIKEIIIVSEQWDGAAKDLAQNIKERNS